MLRTGHLLRPASNPASRPRTGASLPGTLASPRTGLAPAGCPQLVAWLRHHNMNLLVVMAPKLLDALPEVPLGVTRESTSGLLPSLLPWTNGQSPHAARRKLTDHAVLVSFCCGSRAPSSPIMPR